MSEKTVLIIFKTHLDIGFTDYSARVVSNYLDSYIPNAIRVGYELLGSDTPFIWTAGSWMIDLALRHDKTGKVEQAVRDGILNWHALPFTTHTELMNPTLFKLGLGISKKLDERFGRKTIGAKMTDVPGHTKGMIPYMCENGVKFLHIGINPATPTAPVPPLFRWKCGEDSITVMYQGDYGQVARYNDFAVCFAHTGDNLGPQSKEQIIAVYDELRKEFPGRRLKAATLSDLAEAAMTIPNLPILENEIGDTWIHGAATDPGKLSRYRRLLRMIAERGECDEALKDSLLLVPEHTWGMDIKTYFHDAEHFTQSELEPLVKERSAVEGSWEEQRGYVSAAEKLLGAAPEYPLPAPSLEGLTKDAAAEPSFELSWQIFDNSDYDRYKRDYMRLTKENLGWASWDFTKVGLPDYRGGIYTARVVDACSGGGRRVFRLEFDDELAERYGLPYFLAEESEGKLSISWFGKKPSRLPQACWLKLTGLEESWELDKLGRWISPESIVGSPLISAVDSGVRNREYLIRSLDAALVAPYGRRLLHYADRPERQDLYFNLYNNIWNTNFPMWYSDDAVFRFELEKR